MNIAFIVFDRMTTLDFYGFFDAVTRLSRIDAYKEKVTWDLCATTKEVKDDRGVTISVNKTSPDLAEYDMIFIPGGMPTRQLRNDPEFIAWLQTASDSAMKVSVCTGALLLGAAGWLEDKRATTNPTAYELLEPYCKEVARSRIVKDGNMITGGGVAASIDVGLFLVELLAGAEVAKGIQQSMDYPYYRTGVPNGDYTV
ncbi:Isonitrile hydratase [Paenibacillus konkukensis]|uniref:Isonitrile hydratase n=1 Tax=Paenibacillus konkukensis TaxID=2020716 RepID=A0ABY4RSW0_9BACL|nr:DJ-1/PfpI family protein [Paenibacillus konkukensis]UQZ84472.1 Isonitrile hydratase [Paenibacillus konkukensis]